MSDKIKNRVLLALAALSAVLLLGFLAAQGTMAAYTQKYMKAVAATGETQNLFSSDVLTGYRVLPEQTIDYARISVKPTTQDNSTMWFEFQIFNYLPEDRNLINQNNVQYDVSVTLQGTETQIGDKSQYSLQQFKTANDADAVTAQLGFQNGNSEAKITGITLPGRLARTYRYRVAFPQSAMQNGVTFAVKVTVTNGTAGTVLQGLAAVISTSGGSTEVKTGLTAKRLIDPSSYDAYRYELTLSGSESKVKLTWPEYLEIDPLLLSQAKQTAADGSETNGEYNEGKYAYVKDSLADNVNQTKSAVIVLQPGTAIIHFYRANAATDAAWKNLAKSWERGEENVVTAELIAD